MIPYANEVNFDGLVGMTHSYGGLSLGNEPSLENEGEISNPRLAALQGLNKMKFLYSLGIKQAVLPPHERPHIPTLEAIGFQGNARDVLQKAKREAPWIIPHIASSAPMWAANAATVCPSIDNASSKIHFTPANLATYFHRSIEPATTARILKAIFPNTVFFEHHPALPSSELFLDEGAANHTRFCKTYGSPGVHLFTFGKSLQPAKEGLPKPVKYPARQTKEASMAIARLHRIYPGNMQFAFQSPQAIDQGAFHHDLLGVGNENVLLIHEMALWKQSIVLENLKKAVAEVCNTDLIVIEVSEKQLPVKEALKSYFFNSQIVTLQDNSMSLIVPSSCRAFDSVNRFLNDLVEDNRHPIGSFHFLDLSESLKNGGGPACLRLRVVMNATELEEMNPGVLFTEKLYQELVAHVNQYYPTELSLKDLADPKLYEQNCASLDQISKILNLGNIYSFQNP